MKIIRCLLIALMLLSPVVISAHSGRTDSNGGHYNRKTGEYHYHNKAKAKQVQEYNESKGTEDKAKIENVVYITDTGKKYHRAGCRYLKYSSHEIDGNDAIKRGYTSCKVCRP